MSRKSAQAAASARVMAGVKKETKLVAKQQKQANPRPLQDKKLAKGGGSL